MITWLGILCTTTQYCLGCCLRRLFSKEKTVDSWKSDFVASCIFDVRVIHVLVQTWKKCKNVVDSAVGYKPWTRQCHGSVSLAEMILDASNPLAPLRGSKKSTDETTREV